MGVPARGQHHTNAGRAYRGSRRRLRRIRLRGTWSLEIVLFVIWVLFALFVLVPWIVRHPHV
jgi:hypothetical protein